MSENRELEYLKQNYESIEIPAELKETVAQALKPKRKTSAVRKWSVGAAAAVFTIFTISVNVSPVFAQTMLDVPVLGNVVKILSVKMFDDNNDERHYNAQGEIPVVSGLKDQHLQDKINKEYALDAKQKYEEFSKELGNIPADQFVNQSLSLGYEVVVNDGKLLVVKSYSELSKASTETKVQYKNIDIENSQVLTLPSLFKDDSYIAIINDAIKAQIALDPDSYFTEESEAFKTIRADHTFYINKEGKLVISFDKYEIAAGYMGVVEFVIPTDLIQNSLVSNSYIK